jgi:aconitase A
MTYGWPASSTYVQNPPYFEGMTMEPKPLEDIEGAAVMGLFLDSITTDHISPAGQHQGRQPGRSVPSPSTRSPRRTSTPTARAAATTRS